MTTLSSSMCMVCTHGRRSGKIELILFLSVCQVLFVENNLVLLASPPPSRMVSWRRVQKPSPPMERRDVFPICGTTHLGQAAKW
ncbi:hypothetical protein B0H14DRAFT_3891908 [Mycena olivaceomarginata]|nr:hypothetical protein B0H14DRAFT_3891908 [Mycena olivaceomarginata]